MIKSDQSTNWIIREASQQDRKKLANLIHFEPNIHRHLDWRQPLDFIDDNSFLIIEQNNRLIAALLCPTSDASVSWIRLFASASGFQVEATWHELWSRFLVNLPHQKQVVSMPMQDWFKELLEEYSFSRAYDVVMLSRCKNILPLEKKTQGFRLRVMNKDDIPDVYSVDNSAFNPIWQHSEDDLMNAYLQSVFATVAEGDDGILGYLISTMGPMGGHIARLAVEPNSQSKGIGHSLVLDNLMQLAEKGVFQVTVNTQTDNLASLSLYHGMGFEETGEKYPVYAFRQV